MMTITQIEKNGNILEITNDKGKVYKFDFTTGDLFGICGTSLKLNPFRKAVVIPAVEYADLWTAFLTSGSFVSYQYLNFQEFKNTAKTMEKFVSCMDLISTTTNFLPDQYSADYVAWCKKNEEKFSEENYKAFTLSSLAKNLTKKERLKVLRLNLDVARTKNLIQDSKLRKTFFAILENDARKLVVSNNNEILNLYDSLVKYGISKADTTAGTIENIKIFKGCIY